jgi:hypothetical protein
MGQTLFEEWCHRRNIDVAAGCKLHLLVEKDGARATLQSKIDDAIASHYDDPARLSDRIGRLGYKKTARILQAMLPGSKRARSGQLGEILATEAVPAYLAPFKIPIKRLRWSDGREAALRGEDLIGVARESRTVRFLKGESKSRRALTPSTIAEARGALNENDGRPSQHALGFIMKVLFDRGEDELALIFEEYMLLRSIPLSQLVHLMFTFSGNDASNALETELRRYHGGIEQRVIAMHVADHPEFIAHAYERLEKYAPKR